MEDWKDGVMQDWNMGGLEYGSIGVLRLKDWALQLVSCPRNKHIFRCDQNGPPARREEGAYPERYVTDEQRGRRPIFIATHWAAASWLFFCVVRSSRIDLDMLVARALKNSQLTCGERHAYFGDRTVAFNLPPIQPSILPSFHPSNLPLLHHPFTRPSGVP